jgi:hypothetical protein
MIQVYRDMKVLKSTNYASQAKAYSHQLTLGLGSVSEVVNWANSILSSLHNADDNLTELASCKQQTNKQVLVILSQFIPPPEDDTWWRLTKKMISQALDEHNIQAVRAVSYFYDLAVDGVIPPYDREALYQFELEYACLNEGFAEQIEVDNKVKYFFIET